MNEGNDRKNMNEDWTAEPEEDPDIYVPEGNKYVMMWMLGHAVQKKVDPFEIARKIMGKNFISIEDVEKHFGMTHEQRSILSEADVPKEEILRECADTHILVPYTGLSILEVREKVPQKCFYYHKFTWFNNESFAVENGNPCWLLIRKEPVENSTGKTWEEQLKLLSDTDQLVEARQLVYAIMLYYMLTRERMLEHVYSRTSSISSSGFNVSIGSFDFLGLYFDRFSASGRSRSIGIISSLKF